MSWRDAALLGLRSALRRPARTALTMLAVALGSSLLVALAAIAQTADTRIIGELSKGGPAAAVKVAAAQPDPASPDSDTPKAGAAHDLDQGTVDRIARVSEVATVVPVLAARLIVVPPPRGLGAPTSGAGERGSVDPFNDAAVGVDLAAITDLPVSLVAGQLPHPGSLTEIAVTRGYLDHLHIDQRFPERALGTEVELGAPQALAQARGSVRVRARWSRALITGVVAQQVADGDLLTSIELTRAARSWALAGVDAPDLSLPLPTSQFSGLVVVARDLSSVHSVRATITAFGYSTSAPEHLVATVQKYLHVVDIVLGAIGVIALVIAALGIADALLAAVRERRREIGVLKAIGARDTDVVRWFLVEALLVGVVGGIVGTVAGLGIAAGTGAVVNRYLVDQGLDGVDLGGVPWAVVAAGVGGATLLALLAAAWPALRAARLPAREAVGGV